MKREDAFSGTQDLTGEIRVPPDMVDIYRHAEAKFAIGIEFITPVQRLT